jgi:2-keto-3-deoxy-L-rhamnonate aldolase RhmA
MSLFVTRRNECGRADLSVTFTHSMKTSFVQKLRDGAPPDGAPLDSAPPDGAPLIGTLVSLPLPEISEMLSQVGFDWLFIDMEHSTLSLSDAQRLLLAIQGDCNGLVRIAENSAVCIKQALDLGADGIIVPAVNSAEEARQAVQSAKYPPVGNRSVGIGRAHQYGFQFSDYVSQANATTAVIIQIEHIQAVRNLTEILAVPGIDGVFIGPYDLAGSMNRMGDVQHPDVQEAIQYVKAICRQQGMPIGIFTLRPDTIPTELTSGVRFMAVGTDAAFLWNSGKAVVDQFRSAQ